ncbi:MAG: VanZ family protein [Candidatus Hodarchaeota archaeon]
MMGILRKKHFVIRIIFLIWIFIIAVLSLIPDQNINRNSPKGFISSGRGEMHFIIYFISAVLCYYAFKFKGITFIFLSCFLVFFFGVILEVVQIWIPYRNFNPADIVANAFGIIAFVSIWSIFACFVGRKSSVD